MILGLSLGFVFFGIRNIAEAEKISFTSFGDRNNEIYAMNAVGSNQMRLSNNGHLLRNCGGQIRRIRTATACLILAIIVRPRTTRRRLLLTPSATATLKFMR